MLLETYTQPSKLLILTLDNLSSEELATQMEALGWIVSQTSSLAKLATHISHFSPSAILFYAKNAESYTEIIEWMQHHQTLILSILARVFYTPFWDWQTRLTAIRAGFNFVMMAPVEAAYLSDQLDSLIQKKSRRSYRILILAESNAISYFTNILTSIGVELEFIQTPSQILSCLSELKPELILIADPLPDCSGYEVAKIIRQDSSYISIPIVLLPTNNSLNSNELAEAIYSIDQIIEQPFTTRYLQLVVAGLTKRFRLLTEMIRQDSLTHVLNHSAFKSRLDTEIIRAQRSTNMNITLVMIDIDFFKEINDIYGHPIGDKVIKGIAKYLKKRLRRPDLIGRYGGEEFAIALLDTSSSIGIEVANEIKTAISELSFDSHKGNFSCTVSIGIAALPEHAYDLTSLIDKADKALYHAKRTGRNKICIYSSFLA